MAGTLEGPLRLPDDVCFGGPDIKSSASGQYGVSAAFAHRFDKVWSTSIRARWSALSMDWFAQGAFRDATGACGTATTRSASS